MIDYWTIVRDYKVGDWVQRLLPTSGSVTPYYGRVTAVLTGIGFVDVQWPFANERVSVEELLRINPEAATYIPPSLDFGYYPGWDATKRASQRRQASQYWAAERIQKGFYKELARSFHAGSCELEAYASLWDRFGSSVEDSILKGEVAKFYKVADTLGGLFFGTLAHKTATYWSAPGRQHRATPAEISAVAPSCPKCKQGMRKTTYKMEEGLRARLFACPKCLYLIRQNDIFGPDGGPVEW